MITCPSVRANDHWSQCRSRRSLFPVLQPVILRLMALVLLIVGPSVKANNHSSCSQWLSPVRRMGNDEKDLTWKGLSLATSEKGLHSQPSEALQRLTSLSCCSTSIILKRKTSHMNMEWSFTSGLLNLYFEHVKIAMEFVKKIFFEKNEWSSTL